MAPMACVHTLCTRRGVNSRKFRQPLGYSRKALFYWVKLTNYQKNASRNAFQVIRLDNCGTGGRWFEPTQLYHFPYLPYPPTSRIPAGLGLSQSSLLPARDAMHLDAPDGWPHRCPPQPDARPLLPLANPPSFTHTSRISACGIHVRHSRQVWGFSSGPVDGDGDGVWVLGLAPRRVGPTPSRNRQPVPTMPSGCAAPISRMSRHDLHGPAAVPAQSGLPRLLQA
jgi:hypothetical protein